ncbi:MAG: hypothetical protein KC496_00565 [Anaerolineae bacterium]|nr:hypothetical protein [Anaerolineae bacterium]
MKTCTKCRETKELNAFPILRKNKDGRAYHCKTCAVKATQARQRTLEGLIKKIYHNQRMTTSKMGRAAPTYSEQELFEWALSHGYERMWQNWVISGYDKWLSPSIDRKDNTESYTMTNIQLVTWRQNLENQKIANRTGSYLHTHSKSVDQLTLAGDFIRTFPSAAIAAREMTGHNRNISNITQVCRGKWKSAYGYKWRFHDPTLC